MTVNPLCFAYHPSIAAFRNSLSFTVSLSTRGAGKAAVTDPKPLYEQKTGGLKTWQ